MATIAFLGLGNMGGPMAKNLLAAGHALTVFDLVEAACAAVAAEGASIAASAAEAAESANVIVSMLPAGKHVEGTFLGESGLLAKVSRARYRFYGHPGIRRCGGSRRRNAGLYVWRQCSGI